MFLGFTKCGQYVVSYTCTMDADHQSVLPVCTYEYKLQWWWFVPNQPLKKVRNLYIYKKSFLGHLSHSGDLLLCDGVRRRVSVIVR